jgi:hypothetical protein
LTDGTYTVQSLTISAEDGDPDRTTWTFTVFIAAIPTKVLPTLSPTTSPSEPTASETPAPAATPSPTLAPTTSPSATAGPSDPTSGSGSDVLLPIIAALAIVAVGAGFLLLRGRGTG